MIELIAQKKMEVIMSRIKLFFGITLLCYCGHLGANPSSDIIKEESQCRCLLDGNEKETHERARKEYAKAVECSFHEQWIEAVEASGCAGLLDHGSTDWAFDAKNFSENHIH